MPVTGMIFLTGGLGLAGLPPFGTWAGKAAPMVGYYGLTSVASQAAAKPQVD
jgi:formate hydrogenlyase subunit 3/multisubunit Na+/H+ antiporter MnhD subunit